MTDTDEETFDEMLKRRTVNGGLIAGAIAVVGGIVLGAIHAIEWLIDTFLPDPPPQLVSVSMRAQSEYIESIGLSRSPSYGAVIEWRDLDTFPEGPLPSAIAIQNDQYATDTIAVDPPGESTVHDYAAGNAKLYVLADVDDSPDGEWRNLGGYGLVETVPVRFVQEGRE